MKVKFDRKLWVFVCAYGPCSERDETERETFWNNLNDCLQSFGANVSIVLDLNVHVGDEVVKDVVAKYEMLERNENGERMIVLCVERDGGLKEKERKKKEKMRRKKEKERREKEKQMRQMQMKKEIRMAELAPKEKINLSQTGDKMFQSSEN